MADQPYGPLGETPRLGPSEYDDDDDLGWAGTGDGGLSKGRVLPAEDALTLHRRQSREALDRAFNPPGDTA